MVAVLKKKKKKDYWFIIKGYHSGTARVGEASGKVCGGGGALPASAGAALPASPRIHQPARSPSQCGAGRVGGLSGHW